MRIARFVSGDNPAYGVVELAQDNGDHPETISVLNGDPLAGAVNFTGERLALDDVRLVAPVIPRSKIVAVARNYVAHADELGNDVPEVPMVFLKPNTSVIGPDDPVVLPPWAKTAYHGPELAVVIGRACKDVAVSRVKDVIFGYTVANDVSAAAGDNTRAKAFDTSCPIGPVIETDLDTADLKLESKVDGEVRHEGSTSKLMFSVAELVAHASSIFTLLPGDIVLTGIPAGVGGAESGEIEAGQDVEVSCESIGSFRNPVLRRD